MFLRGKRRRVFFSSSASAAAASGSDTGATTVRRATALFWVLFHVENATRHRQYASLKFIPIVYAPRAFIRDIAGASRKPTSSIPHRTRRVRDAPRGDARVDARASNLCANANDTARGQYETKQNIHHPSHAVLATSAPPSRGVRARRLRPR
uniref:Uncharacterized protein n=1 Tax=Ostreococcus mediterraneus TaxID=1486918 RepID=A0A7S2QY23_9CHLO